MGSNNWEAAQIISIQEHLKEMLTAFRTLAALTPWGAAPSAESIDKWFDEGATDVSGPADRSGYSTRYLTWWMGRIEAALGDKGFAVGDKLSLADVLIYNLFGDYLKPEEAPAELPEYKRYPFTDKERTDAALAKHSKIKASVDAVANHLGMQKWLEIRGVQSF